MLCSTAAAVAVLDKARDPEWDVLDEPRPSAAAEPHAASSICEIVRSLESRLSMESGSYGYVSLRCFWSLLVAIKLMILQQYS